MQKQESAELTVRPLRQDNSNGKHPLNFTSTKPESRRGVFLMTLPGRQGHHLPPTPPPPPRSFRTLPACASADEMACPTGARSPLRHACAPRPRRPLASACRFFGRDRGRGLSGRRAAGGPVKPAPPTRDLEPAVPLGDSVCPSVRPRVPSWRTRPVRCS